MIERRGVACRFCPSQGDRLARIDPAAYGILTVNQLQESSRMFATVRRQISSGIAPGKLQLP
jgi:hypothetical protein